MDYKDFLSNTQTALETRLDHIVPIHEARIEKLARLAKMLKPGLSEVWRAQYENIPTKIEKPDGL